MAQPTERTKGNKIIERKKSEHALSTKAEEWLEREYPKNGSCEGTFDKKNEKDEKKINKGKKREEVEYLNISKKKLEGELDLTSFRNLKELDCSGNKITSLNVERLDKLSFLDCSENEITFLKLSNSTALKQINCANNKIEEIDFSKNDDGINLEILKCHKNPLKKINGLYKLTKLVEFMYDKNKPDKLEIYSPIKQLREEVKESFLIGENGYRELLEKEIEVFRGIIKAPLEGVSQEQKNLAVQVSQQLKDAYETKIELVKPWS